MSRFQDVLAALREYVTGNPGPFDIWAPRWELSKTVPGSTTDTGALATTFSAQVIRAANVLVAEDVLVRRGSGRDVTYMTPAVQEGRVAAAEQARQDRAAELAAWRQRKMRLAGHRLRDLSTSVTDIRLGPGAWDEILAVLDDARPENAVPCAATRTYGATGCT